MYISKTTDKAVRVLAHSDGMVNFVDAAKFPDVSGAADMADSEFFTQFREATADEIEAVALKVEKRAKSEKTDPPPT